VRAIVVAAVVVIVLLDRGSMLTKKQGRNEEGSWLGQSHRYRLMQNCWHEIVLVMGVP
jgi:hypothetical protein